MTALLRAIALTAWRHRWRALAVLLTGGCAWLTLTSEKPSSNLETLRIWAPAGFGLLAGVVAMGLIAARHQAEFLDALPVSTHAAWGCAWLTSLLAVAGFTVVIMLPALPLVGGAADESDHRWLSSARAAWAAAAAMACTGHAAGMLGRACTRSDLTGLLVGLVLIVIGFAASGIAEDAWGTYPSLDRVAGPIAVAALVTWFASFVALGTGRSPRREQVRRGFAVGVTVAAAVELLMLANQHSSRWSADAPGKVTELFVTPTQAGPRLLAHVHSPAFGDQLLSLAPDGTARQLGRGHDLLAAAGNLIVTRRRLFELVSAGRQPLTVIDVVTGRARDWAADHVAARGAYGHTHVLVARSGRRLVALGGPAGDASRTTDHSFLVVHDESGREVMRRAVGCDAWLLGGDTEVLVGWRPTHGCLERDDDVRQHRVAWLDPTDGQVRNERDVPWVVDASADVRLLACQAWRHDEQGWHASIGLVRRDDGQARVLLAEDELDGWPEHSLGRPSPRHDAHDLDTSGTERPVPRLAFDAAWRRAAWLQRRADGPVARFDLFVVDLPSGDRRLLVSAQDLPVRLMADETLGTRGVVAIVRFTADGRGIVVRFGDSLFVVDVDTGQREVIAAGTISARGDPVLAASGRRAAWRDTLHRTTPSGRRTATHVVATMVDGRPTPVIAASRPMVAWLDDDRLVVADEEGQGLVVIDLTTRRRTLLLR